MFHRWSTAIAALGFFSIVGAGFTQGCGGTKPTNGFANNDGGASSSGGSGGSGSSGGTFGNSSSGSSGGSSSGGGVACPPGLQCNVSCPGGGTTSVTGKVFDPAKLNALYDIAVYVPAIPLQPLPPGVPTGADKCDCASLFPSGAVVSTTTGVDGSFKLTNVPVGSAVPLVLQVGKWRRQVTLDITQCGDNPQTDGTLSLPGSIPAGDTVDNMPDIAVSTGNADTLECLMLRMGLPATEYVAGPGGAGHIHVFSGGNPANGPTGNGGPGGGPEDPPMTGAPESDTTLWDMPSGQTLPAHLMPYDILLLSCEGDETYNANPQALEAYLNAGGRAFASHYHYAWFAGPTEGGQSYAPPADWGDNLAQWNPNQSGADAIGGIIDQALNGSTKPFAKGQALYQWLGLNNALVTGVQGHELPIFGARFDGTVGPNNKPSQPWIVSDSLGVAGVTEYFSFDTPVGAPDAPDGGPPSYCGRAVFSDLHVAGAQADTNPPPTGCVSGPLSAQEKALEFMIFDLSSCVIPDSVPPSDAGIPILQ